MHFMGGDCWCDVCVCHLLQLAEDNSIEAKMVRSIPTASKMTMALQLERMVGSIHRSSMLSCFMGYLLSSSA